MHTHNWCPYTMKQCLYGLCPHLMHWIGSSIDCWGCYDLSWALAFGEPFVLSAVSIGIIGIPEGHALVIGGKQERNFEVLQECRMCLCIPKMYQGILALWPDDLYFTAPVKNILFLLVLSIAVSESMVMWYCYYL